MEKGPWRRSDATPVWPQVRQTEENPTLRRQGRRHPAPREKAESYDAIAASDPDGKNPSLTTGVWTQTATPTLHVRRSLKTPRAVATLRCQRGYSGTIYGTSPAQSPKPLRRHIDEKYDGRKIRDICGPLNQWCPRHAYRTDPIKALEWAA